MDTENGGIPEKRNENEDHRGFFFGGNKRRELKIAACGIWGTCSQNLDANHQNQDDVTCFLGSGDSNPEPNCYWKRGPHPTYGVDALILGVCGDGGDSETIERLGQVESEQIYHKMINILNRC